MCMSTTCPNNKSGIGADFLCNCKPMEEKQTAILYCSLNISCPSCNESIDLLDGPYDDDGIYSTPIFNNNWGELKGRDITCEKCECEFLIEDVEY